MLVREEAKSNRPQCFSHKKQVPAERNGCFGLVIVKREQKKKVACKMGVTRGQKGRNLLRNVQDFEKRQCRIQEVSNRKSI